MGNGSPAGSANRLSVLTFCIVLHCFAGQILSVSGFPQELWLYVDEDHQGDHRWFENNQPNLTYYAEYLPTVKAACFTGVWQLYSEENFKNEYVSLGSFETASEVQTCEPINGSQIQSLRRIGPSDTDNKGIDLWTEKGYKGNVFSSTNSEAILFNVNATVRSLAATGTATSILLYEDEDLQGDYRCIPIPRFGYAFTWVDDIQYYFNISTIRSTVAGRFCPDGVLVDNVDILVEELRQKYKKQLLKL